MHLNRNLHLNRNFKLYKNLIQSKILKNYAVLINSDVNNKRSCIKNYKKNQFQLIRINYQRFSSEGNKQQNEGNKQQNEGNKQQSEENKEENTNTNEEQKRNDDQDQQEQEDSQTNYKTSRKIRYALGKTFKWLFIFGTLITIWNAYLLKKKNKPKEHYGYFEPSYKLVKNIKYFWFITYGSLTLPYYEKILPDALELVGQPSKKTLVINLNKTLINYEYKFGRGFEILKRPGLLRFLQEMGKEYELVIFGTEDSNFVEEVSGKLDQLQINIKHMLGKEATRLVNRRYVKDLYFLNRDLKNVICIDYDPENVMFNPENTLVIPEFNGDGKDRELIQAIVFLKEMAKPEVKDVRNVFNKFGNYRTYVNFYKSNPKFKKLLPKEDYITDDPDLQAVINKK